jgi:hypothetical protein
MAERPAHTSAPWQVPVAVDEVPDDGRHFDLTADADTRAAIAKLAALRDLPRLEAHLDVVRHGAVGLRVAGRVSATVGQNCVVTLDPLTNEVLEDVELVFAPAPKSELLPDRSEPSDKGNAPPPERPDETEPLLGGSVDLGAIAIEFLLLGIDPYPRKPGAEFDPPKDASPEQGPFAALEALKKNSDAH